MPPPEEDNELKNIIDCVPTYEHAVDYRPMITHECACGSTMFRLIVTFEDYEIATYFLDMECIACGSRYNAPTLPDLDELQAQGSRDLDGD